MNRLTQVTDALGGITHYSYDANGNLASVIDARGHMTAFSYDSMNRLIASTDPLGRTESYLYDLNGNLIRKIKRDGATIDYLYDPANQLIERRSTDDVRRYTYDLNANLTSILDNDSDVSFEYDALDRVIRTTAQRPSPSALDYTYDPVGNRLSMTHLPPAASPLTTSYTYDVMNRLVHLSNPESQIWNFSYDAAGRRTALAHPNGILTSYNYDPASRLLSLHHNQGGTPVAHFDYAYDAVGNRTAKGELDGTTAYGYDALNRLIGASTTVPGLPQEFYSYDAVGNRVTSYISSLHLHDTANQLIEDQQFFYSYDPNGNQTGKTAKDGSERWVYTYDAENRLVRVDKFVPSTAATPAMTASYAYDGLGRRIAKTVNGFSTTYVYDRKDIVDISGVRVTHGPRFDEPYAVGDRLLLADALGSIVAEVTATLSSTLKYESYGRAHTTAAPPYSFTSREVDFESGLMFFRARYYDPAAGRFVSRDPIGLRAGLNPYRYVFNNPVRWMDPRGLDVTNLSDETIWVKDGETDQVFPVNPGDTWPGNQDGISTTDRPGEVYKNSDWADLVYKGDGEVSNSPNDPLGLLTGLLDTLGITEGGWKDADWVKQHPDWAKLRQESLWGDPLSCR